MKDTALAYLRNGLSVLPAIKDQKRPAFAWKEYQNRLPAIEEWQKWFADALCIVCGAVSGNLLMMDFDQQGKVFDAFKERCPKEIFDRLVIETSQSGGRHIIFRTEQPVGGSEKLAICADKKILIETRGEKALFLCAPTPGYVLLQGNFQDIPVLNDSETASLFALARTFSEYQDPASPPSQPPLSVKRTAPMQPIASGKRPGDALNETGAAFIREILQKHGWICLRQKSEHDELWRRPGKTFGASAIFHTDTPTFHVFSTDATPFNASTYSYFKVYATLEHGGDYCAAAKALAALGYGDPLIPQVTELPEFIERKPESEAEPEEYGYDHDHYHDDCPGNFPEHLLDVPGFVNEVAQYMNEVAHNEQPVYSLAAALAFQALLCAQNVKDPTGIRSNVYIIAAGRSASGKDNGRAVIKKILTQLANNTNYKDFYDPTSFFYDNSSSHAGIVSHLSSTQGVALWLWDEMGKEIPLIANDKSSHLAGIMPVIMRLYTSADSIFLPPLKANKKDMHPPIQQPHLIIYATSEKEKLMSTFSADQVTDGFLGRFLIFEGNDYAKRKIQEEQPPIPENIFETTHWWLKKREDNINKSIPRPDIVPVTDEAKAIFRQFYDVLDQVQSENNRIKDALWGRAVQQARQLALIYASSVCKEQPVIDHIAAQWAYELIEYLIKRKIYIANRHIADSEFDKQQKEILRYIEDCKGTCTLTMLYRKFRKLKKRERDEIVENLISTHAIKTKTLREGSKRQATLAYVINK